MANRYAAPAALLAIAALLLDPGCSNGGSAGAGSTNPSLDASTMPTTACPVDCSTIAAPLCQVAQCNTATHQCNLVPATDGSPCDDGKFCTVDETCKAGACVGKPNDCGLAPPACKSATCDEASRSCSLVAQADGTACTSSDPCTVSGTCTTGQCVGVPKDCSMATTPDACHLAQCNPKTGACDVFVAGNDGAYCPGNDPCTIGQTCLAGACQGGMPNTCSAWTSDCTTAACDAAHHGCYSIPVATDAGAVACGVNDWCNTGTCDSAGHCQYVPANDGAICANGIACTLNQACASGVCVGTGGPQVFFSDTFVSNSRGWTTDPPWQIGVTQSTNDNCKPYQDHTNAGDNGVATTVIGGFDGYVVHDFAYLTSPPIDTSAATSLVLEFWQVIEWLPPPKDEAVVEVWDGTTWTQVWNNQLLTQQSACISQTGIGAPAWQDVHVDILAHKSSAMKIRFGTAAHVIDPLAGWTVDDVSITSASCPGSGGGM